MELLCSKSGYTISEGEYEISSDEVLSRGQVVTLGGDGLVRPADRDQQGPVLGICLEDHTGSAGIFDYRANSAKIRVADGPSLVFACPAPSVAASSGTANTLAAGGIGTFEDNAFKSGLMQFISPGNESECSAKGNDMLPVSGYAGNSGTFTFDKTLEGAVSTGDSFYLYPPLGFSGGCLDPGGKALSLEDNTSGFALRVVGRDTQKHLIYLVAGKHFYGNINN